MSKSNVIEEIKKFKPFEQLVLLGSRYFLTEDEKTYIKSLIESYELNWNEFLGCSMINRVNGVIYKNLKDFKLPKYVKYFLKLAYFEQKERTKIHQNEIFRICEILESEKISYAFLKGAVLNTIFYEPGDRISNDTDVMIHVDHLDKAVEILKNDGYIQGRVSDGVINPATKKDILFARLNTYEIVPLNKYIDERYLPVHSLDINFRLGNDDVEGAAQEMLNDTICLVNQGHIIRTLSLEKFLLFLCIHHYREATMIMKIAKGDDLTLYKFMDIHFFVMQKYETINWDTLLHLAKSTNRLKDVYYTLFYSETLYPGTFDQEVLDMFKPDNIEFLNQYKGRDNTDEIYNWETDFVKRVFSYERRIEAMKNIKEEYDRYTSIVKRFR